MLRREAGRLRAEIAAAQAALELVEGGLACPHEDVAQCPHYQRLVTKAVPPQR